MDTEQTPATIQSPTSGHNLATDPHRVLWRWPQELDERPCARNPAAASRRRLPGGVVDPTELRRMVIAHPDDDAPRHAYAAAMLVQAHPFARTIGAFTAAQLHVAEAFRHDPRADVTRLRSWRSEPAFVSTTAFRAGDTLRPWFIDELRALMSSGLVGWPQVYRGFVERVAMRAGRFLELADELFRVAPIRHLVLICVPEVVDQLAASPHLARIRSISLPRHSGADELSDDTVARLVASPHLSQLAHLRLVHQQGLSARAFERIATTATLPQLSHLEIYTPLRLGEHDAATYDPIGRSERMIAFDTPMRAVQPKDWIAELEHGLGYVPCAHGDDHYGRGFVDIEAVVAHPIALDARIMARRGQPVTPRQPERIER
jgi:hypothetical protein